MVRVKSGGVRERKLEDGRSEEKDKLSRNNFVGQISKQSQLGSSAVSYVYVNLVVGWCSTVLLL